MSPRAVIALGLGQCVNWGVLYYAFAVLLLPVEAELGVQRWVVAGAYSVALLVSALAAPTIGRWTDRGRCATLMRAGGYLAAVLLGIWALFPNVAVLYAVWTGLGLCMAATLYEPAFAVVGRAHRDPAARLRALGIVTLFGGLASTVFLPLTDALVQPAGWRVGVAALAALLAASTWLVHATVFDDGDEAPFSATADTAGITPAPVAGPAPPLRFLLLAFAFASLSGAAIIANLVPALAERAIAPASAAAFGAIFGLMQLPGRALMLHRRLSVSPPALLAGSLGAQGAGLALWAVIPSVPFAIAGLTLFALGSGLMTLVRPHLVHAVFVGRAGYVNGQLAQAQGFARAGGPILAAGAVTLVSYSVVIGVLGAISAALAIAALAKFTGHGRQGPGFTEEQRMTEAVVIRSGKPIAGACCGGAAPEGSDACCARDADVKSTGGAGCGCTSAPAPTQKTVAAPKACCG